MKNMTKGIQKPDGKYIKGRKKKNNGNSNTSNNDKKNDTSPNYANYVTIHIS